MNPETLKNLAEELLSLPAELRDLQIAISNHQTSIDSAQRQISILESDLKSKINDATDQETGKKLYPNEDARKTALIKAASEDLEILSIKEKIQDLSHLLNVNKFEFEYHSNRQRNIRSILAFFSNSDQN
jgi:GTP1/Obg family GTP-binding protein